MTDTSSLRILLVGDYANDPRLGSGKVAHKLGEELRALGHQCDALFTEDIGLRPSNRHMRQLVGPILAARAIGRALSVCDYDVVDAASAEGLWFAVQRRLGTRPKTAIVCRSNGLEHLNYRRMLDDSRAGLTHKSWPRRIWFPLSRLAQVSAAARLADRLLLLNEPDRQFAIAHGWQPADRIDVVPHGVSDRFLGRSRVEGPRGHGALFCGSWDNVKGVSYLVAAFTQLAKSDRPVRLTILGPGRPSQDVLAAFPDVARPFVTVVDRVPEERVVQEYRRHDLLVFPSTYEGFGLVVLEALSQGLPVVATPVGCASLLVRDGETGIRVPPRDSGALAGAVDRLMTSGAERARMGANAAAAVASMSWRHTAERTVEVYRKAIARRPLSEAAA